MPAGSCGPAPATTAKTPAPAPLIQLPLTFTQRQAMVKQPGACMHCHASIVVPYKRLGGGDLFKGFERMNQMPYAEARYDEASVNDWTHAGTGAPALKAQHPEFEMWNQGIHARSGVACADCHMPYTRQGALKISDRHVRSSMLNINRACQTCHRWPEAELGARVEAIQERTFRLRNLAMDALVALIEDVRAARILAESINFARLGQLSLRPPPGAR